MSKLVEKCLPFYKILKKEKAFRWNEEFEKALTCLREYLSFPLILTRSKVRETLFLYIATFDKAVWTVLSIEKNGE